ncbi:P-loop containing nucleoside triphosphate hydrolase protein [Coprinopsis marcescibilis]|uniref:P-loop containing nucleoside triphosphate hydrolase protein n=1 Tax=Coprinopsis marcescibilis TaxID=230819 RepID=A0A5C3KM58_COPMA|nr:P-loop containing nucleoside triphosphate hydrolase protein [Coprinopsis marcescibilis]
MLIHTSKCSAQLFNVLKSRPCLRSSVRAKSTLSAAEQVFADPGAAEFVAAAGSLKSIPMSQGLPEVIVTGRANAGKSTLFNAVIARKALLHTSSKAGRTRELNFFRVGEAPGKLLLVDAPGYGARGRKEWGELFDNYLDTREELRRIYILFNAKHGLNNFDRGMLEHISQKLLSARGTQPFTLQAVITKADLVPPGKLSEVITKMRKEIFASAPLCLPPIITSCEMNPAFGVDKVRESIAQACGFI